MDVDVLSSQLGLVALCRLSLPVRWQGSHRRMMEMASYTDQVEEISLRTRDLELLDAGEVVPYHNLVKTPQAE